VQVDVEGPFAAEVGDTYLLCSDGLSGQVSDEEIGSILAGFPAAEAAQMLVDLANLRGGPDNITVLVAQIEHPSATNASGEHAPLTVGGNQQRKAAPPLVWVLAIALLLAGGGLALAGSYPLAAIAAGAGLICLCVGLVMRGTFASGGDQLSGDRRLGEGPYTRTVCKVGPDFVKQLATMTQELRQAIIDKQWEVDVTEFDRLCQAASDAAKSQNLVAAMQGYGRALSFLLRELRSNRRRSSSESDSAVDL
jgi:protein phosphatase